MDLLHNPNRPQHTQESSNNSFGPAPAATSAPAPHPSKNNKGSKLMSVKGLTLVLLFGIVVILVALVVYTIVGKTNTSNESSYVDTSDYQAVFVNIAGTNGGQAYFGHIASINTKYVVLNSVFYLEPGASTNQFTLNNLSCALYNPADQMIINRDQIAYWENLKSNSQVTGDINKWIADKLTCASTSSTGTATTPSTTGTTDNTSK